MPTAFLTASTFEVLPFLGTPGAATVGHALVWSESPQGFTLAPIAVGPEQFSGLLPVAKGGWGTNTGSFTSPGAITLAAGGTNQNINLTASGTGFISCGNTVVGPGARFGDSPLSPGRSPNPITRINAEGRRLDFENYVASNAGDTDYVIFSNNRARGTLANPQSTQVGDRVFGFFTAARADGFWQGASAGFLFEVDGFVEGQPEHMILFYTGGFGDNPFKIFPRTVEVAATTQSTSTTNGACRIAGGLGVALNTNVGGSLKVGGSAINFANLPTASTGLNSGDLWRDSNGFLRVV